MSGENIDIAFAGMVESGVWEINDDRTALYSELKSEYTSHEICIHKHYTGDMVFFSCSAGVGVNPTQKNNILIFLNRVNIEIDSGHFICDEFNKYLFHNYGWMVPHEVGHDVLEEEIRLIASYSVGYCENYYPLFHAILWGGLPPEEATLLLDNEIQGSA